MATSNEGVALDVPESSTAVKSPFFHIPPKAGAGDLAILHLSRNQSLPVTLREGEDDQGYAEGAVTNTRFGSFPHSTLIGLEWGAQVRASKVDTGTRGRKPKEQKSKNEANSKEGKEASGRKRSSEDAHLDATDRDAKAAKISNPTPDSSTSLQPQSIKAPIEAGSGFIHLLPPTPEAWTSSLDHRTQVVYNPDYSYILQRLRVRPGDTIIEAGAGSGSFTHAAARAVFLPSSSTSPGRVYSYEYHEPRVQTLRKELAAHNLDDMVILTHKDVCTEGFTPASNGLSPHANAVFLDLPAPWQALKHLNRNGEDSPLNPKAEVQLCSFSPCIEQVMATVSFLRRAGWVEVEMVAVANARIDVRRELIGLQYEGMRGVNASAASVEESIARLREVEGKMAGWHKKQKGGVGEESGEAKGVSRQERLQKNREGVSERKLWKEGIVTHRTEPEVKSHTSYLVFAVLPREWSEEDERKCAEDHPVVIPAKKK